MKKSPLVLAGACLILGFFGCETDEPVQKGYLTPQQTASSSTTETSSTTTSSSTSERLPPPSAKQEVAATESTSTTTTQTQTTTSEPSNTTSTTETTTSTETESKPAPAPAKKQKPTGPSPNALAKNEQRPGGKVGGAGASIRRSSEREAVEKDEPEQTQSNSRLSARQIREREEDEEAAADRTESRPASSTVTSSFATSSSPARVSDPTGNAKGVILTVNTKGKFVVVKFNYRALPSVGKVLSVMRNGEKVGQIKITKPIRPPHATADILEGDVGRGDTIE